MWQIAKVLVFGAGGNGKDLNMQLDSDPVSLLLGIPNKCIVSSANKKLFNILSFAVRIFFFLNWISDKSPSLKGWHKIIFELIPLEHLTHVLHQKTVHIWTKWNLIFALLYYKEYCVCVILWTFNFSALFFLLLPPNLLNMGCPVLCKNLSCFILVYFYLFCGVMSCYFCITVKIL